MMESILVFAGGLIAGVAFVYFIYQKRQRRVITENSVVLIERVKQLMKGQEQIAERLNWKLEYGSLQKLPGVKEEE